MSRFKEGDHIWDPSTHELLATVLSGGKLMGPLGEFLGTVDLETGVIESPTLGRIAGHFDRRTGHITDPIGGQFLGKVKENGTICDPFGNIIAFTNAEEGSRLGDPTDFDPEPKPWQPYGGPHASEYGSFEPFHPHPKPWEPYKS